MVESLDVGARLAEGRPAVDTVGEYVWACHLLGYQNPDLTLHAAQVRDWYGSEDGLDLNALEADRAALVAAATAADNARDVQEQQLDVLAGAWRGRGGAASEGFLRRHSEASAAAASAARSAAEALGTLRDDLWHAVDGKVGAAVAIDDRRHAQREQWLSASQTVTTGAGDRAAASELIDQQVKPFVDNDIRADWVTAMQKAMAAVSAAFDAATGMLADAARTTFEVPEGLGPDPVPPSRADTAQADSVGATAPAAWQAAAAAPPMSSPWPASAVAAPAPVFPVAAPDPPAAPTVAAPPAAPTPAAALPTAPAMPSLGELGGGLPTGGGLPAGGGLGGLAGLGTQLADAIGGLLDRSDSGLPDPSDVNGDTTDADTGVDDHQPDEENAGDDKRDDDTTDDGDKKIDEQAGEGSDDQTDSGPTEAAAANGNAGEPQGTCADEMPVDDAEAAAPVPTEAPVPVPTEVPAPVPQPSVDSPPVVEPPPNPEPVGAQTPCEIAADELPQAGP